MALPLESLIESFRKEWFDSSDTIETSTSGTTSGGKPVSLSKGDMAISARATLDYLKLWNPFQTFVMTISPAYIGGKMMIVRAILSGARLVAVPPAINPLEALPADVSRIHLLAIVPAQVDNLVECSRSVTIDNVIIGGAPLPPAAERKLLETMADTNIYVTYGMTETSSHVALRRLGDRLYHAMPGVSFSLSVDGCLTISHEKASWSPLVTRDMAELHSTREMKWLGRADNLINTGGLKVNPEELEAMIQPAMGDTPYFITSMPHPQWGEAIVLVVESQQSVDVDRIKTELAKLMPHKFLPKRIVTSAQFRRTPTGKIIRRIDTDNDCRDFEKRRCCYKANS